MTIKSQFKTCLLILSVAVCSYLVYQLIDVVAMKTVIYNKSDSKTVVFAQDRRYECYGGIYHNGNEIVFVTEDDPHLQNAFVQVHVSAPYIVQRLDYSRVK